LPKFKLVNIQGLKGLSINGDYTPFERIDDELAEKLLGKTHVFERVAEAPMAATVAVAEATSTEESPDSVRKARS
jgi:hypothetical protein